MSTLEIILSSLVTFLTASNVVQFFSIKQIKAKQDAETKDQETTTKGRKDNILYARIEFLDKRITKLEELACFNVDCKQRV